MENETDAGIVCDVCLDGDDEEGNEILICEICLVATHQLCYGGKLINGVPKDDWYCDRCLVLKNEPLKKPCEISCIFCS